MPNDYLNGLGLFLTITIVLMGVWYANKGRLQDYRKERMRRKHHKDKPTVENKRILTP